MATELRVLGPVEVLVDGHAIELGPPRQRFVLAALLVDAGHVVPGDELVERVWGERAPSGVRTTLRTYLSRLRVVLAATGATITRRTGGYVLSCDRAAVDLHRFRALVASAGTDDAAARPVLEAAIALWHGTPFAGLDSLWLAALRDTLEAELAAAQASYAEIRLRAGEHAALVPELADRARARPFDERVAGQLMEALSRSGRQGDAIAQYGLIRQRLAAEFGVEPGPELRELYQRLLGGGATRTARPVPAMLPPGVAGFVGRDEHLAQLDHVVDATERRGAAVVISAVSGAGGVGKTALALHWAHRAVSRFPDGHLYANLRGFDPAGSPLLPERVLRLFLEVLGVAPPDVPRGLDERVALFRGVVAGKRLLVVLDNARDADQVRPLLPGDPRCLVVVTSRNRLTGLVVAEGARLLMVDVLPTAECRALLAERLGAARVAGAGHATDEIITRCAHLPLALAVVAARAAATPREPLAAVARALGGSGAPLDDFASDDSAADVRAVLSWSYHVLGTAARRLFRLLGRHHGPEFGVDVAASAAGLPVAGVRPLLRELTGVHLLEEQAPGRHSFHDLVRAYAIELAGPDRDEAGRRVLDHYLHTANSAAQLLSPHRSAPPLDPAASGVVVTRLTDLDDALRWFTAEQANLLAAIQGARESGAHAHAWRLALTLTEFFDRRGHLQEQEATYRLALDSVRHTGDVAGRAHLHRNLGRTYAQAARFADAREQFGHALTLYAELGDHRGQAKTEHNLGWMSELEGRHADSLRHDQRALELYEKSGDRIGQAWALNAVGWSYALLGDYERSLACCARALVLNRELGDKLGESATLDSIGHAHHHLGRYDEALAGYRASLALLRELGDRDNEADVLVHVGDTLLAMGDRDSARRAWRDAVGILEELGHPAAHDVAARLAELGT